MALGKLTATLLALALLPSCAHQALNREALAGVKRVGIVSVVIDRFAAAPSDEPVLRAAADRGLQRVNESLARRKEWEVVPLAAFKDHPRYQALLEVKPEPPSTSRKNDVKEVGAALASLFKGGGAGKPATDMLLQVPARSGAKYVAAAGMPVLPWSAFDSAKHGDGGWNQKQQGPALEYEDHARETIRKQAGKLAGDLGLDAVAVVYLKSAILSTVGINTIVNGRGVDTVRMNPTMIVVAKDGAVVLDLGAKNIDAVTQGRAAVPVYAVAYDKDGKHKERDGRRFSLVTDLADPNGTVAREMVALVDEAIPDLTKAFDALLTSK